MNFEGFGFKYHMDPCYLLASNDFIELPHFNDEGEPVDNTQIKKFTNFILSLDSDNSSLESYLKEGGNLLDSYEYFQYGNGEHIIITIQELIISLGSVRLVREMISIDPEYINILVVNDHSLLSHSIIYCQNEITDLLLVHGADPNIQGKRSKTSLYHAINSNNPELVKKLLDNGADPNMRYALGGVNYLYTAINYNTYATKEKIENNKKIIKMLIKSGAQFYEKLYNNKEKNMYDEIIVEMNETREY